MCALSSWHFVMGDFELLLTLFEFYITLDHNMDIIKQFMDWLGFRTNHNLLVVHYMVMWVVLTGALLGTFLLDLTLSVCGFVDVFVT